MRGAFAIGAVGIGGDPLDWRAALVESLTLKLSPSRRAARPAVAA
jgi:hypothetical protein